MNFGELLMANSMFGEDDPKKKENPFGKEMRVLSHKKLPYDNLDSLELSRVAAKQTGVNPALLLPSAFQEGLNKAIAHPDEVSEAYINAKIGDDFPVDGFYNYGIDKFGDYLPKIQQYLPKDFEQRYKTFQATNEIGEPITTVAFKSNQDAMIVKGAILRDAMNEVDTYAKEKGVVLDEDAKNYFTLARYNAKPETFKLMMDEYSQAADKKKFIKEGLTSKKNIHKNISPRLENMTIANELLNENPLGNIP